MIKTIIKGEAQVWAEVLKLTYARGLKVAAVAYWRGLLAAIEAGTPEVEVYHDNIVELTDALFQKAVENAEGLEDANVSTKEGFRFLLELLRASRDYIRDFSTLGYAEHIRMLRDAHYEPDLKLVVNK